MKIKSKKILNLCLILGLSATMSLVPSKNSFAETLGSGSIKILSSGSDLKFITNGGWFRMKYTESGRMAYCLNHDADSPGGQNVSFSSEFTNAAAKYILEVGYNQSGYNPKDMRFFKDSSGNAYSDSGAKYYVTQQALSLAIGDKDLSKFTNNVNKAGANKHYGQNAINLYNAAMNYARTVSQDTTKAKEKAPRVTLSVSPTTLSFTKNGDYYVSRWHTKSSSGADSISETVVEGPWNTAIEKSGNQFRVKIPVSSVGNAIHDVKIKVSASGTTSGSGGKAYKYVKGTSYQPVVIYDRTAGSPGTSSTETVYVSGTVGECDTSPLPDNWIQVKRLFLNGRYNIKQGNNNVGTFKIGQNYVLNPVVQYDYSTYWGGDLARSQNKDSKNSNQNKINSKYENILEKYTTKESNKAKETSSKVETTTTANTTKVTNVNTKVETKTDKKEASKEAEGCAIDSRATYTCPPRPRPERPNAGSISGTIYYTIKYVHMDGTVKATQTGTANTGTLTIQGNPSSGSTSKFSDQPINIRVPNIEKLVEAQIELTLNDSKLNIRVPIEIQFEEKVWVDKISTSLDNCTLNYAGEEVAIKGDIKSNTIKTKNYDTTLTVRFNGGRTQTFSKKVYGISEVTPGNVFYKFKIPTYIPGTQTKVTSVQFTITVEGSSKSSRSIAVREMDASSYNENLSNKRNAYNLVNSSFATYLKVEKTDKTKPTYQSCGGCQTNGTTGSKTCPTHLVYVWDEPYVAFVVKEVSPIKGIEEEINLTSVKIRNKTTKDKLAKGDTKLNGIQVIDSDGYADIKKLTRQADIETFTKMKAGYGFEMIIDAKYKTNLPDRMSRVSRTNSANLTNTSWQKYSYFTGGNPLPLINEDRDNKLRPYLSNRQAVIFLNPAIDEMPISTLNQMFIKMPDSAGTIVNVKDKLDLTDGKGNTVPASQADRIDYREEITPRELTREKTFEFKKVNDGFRKYYLSKETTNNKYSLNVVTAPSGIKLDCGSKPMIADRLEFNIDVSGGYQDDVKTHLNE